MGYTVRLRKNSTGEIRARSYDDEWDDVQAYSWEDGGFACDCNRDLEFQRAALPESEVDWSTGTCGESEYTVLDVSLPDGSVIPLEQENTGVLK